MGEPEKPTPNMEWYFYLIFFVSFWLLRTLFYYTKLRQIRSLKVKYNDYLQDRTYEFMQYKPQFIELFKLANVTDFSFTHVQQLTYGQGRVHTLSGFNNINSGRQDVVGNISIKIEETIGTFNYRMKQSYNPLFWVEFIINLPQKTFSFLNLNITDSISKIVQIFYWIAMVIIGLQKANAIDIASWF